MKKLNLISFHGSSVYQYLAALSCTLGIISSEMHFGWTSNVLPQLTNGTYKFQITSATASWIAVILLPGTLLGAVIAGKLTDILGRKKVILMSSVPLFTAWIIIGIAHNSLMMYIARFIAGTSSGLLFSTVPMYIGEIAEPKIRGLLASLCPVCVVTGILVINILGNYLPIDTTAYIASIFPILLFMTFMWMPESPSFLIKRNRNEEAHATLVVLRGKEEAEKELERIKLQEDIYKKGRILELFLNRSNRRSALIAYGLRTIQQFAGTTALTFYCETIFSESDNVLPAGIATIIYFSSQFFVAFSMIFIVDSIGRKPLLLVSVFGTSLTLLIMGAYLFAKERNLIDTNWGTFIPVVSLLTNVVFFSIGIRNIPLLMMGEVFSPSIKSIALGFGTMYYSIISFLAANIFYFTNDLLGMSAPFLLFGMLTLSSAVFVIYIVPETKGLTLEQIQINIKKCEKN